MLKWCSLFMRLESEMYDAFPDCEPELFETFPECMILSCMKTSECM